MSQRQIKKLRKAFKGTTEVIYDIGQRVVQSNGFRRLKKDLNNLKRFK